MAGQHEVEDDGVVAAGLGGDPPVVAVGRDVDGEALGLEGAAHAEGDPGLVLHHQHSHRGSIPAGPVVAV